MSETPTTSEQPLEEPSLSDNDLSIILGRALQESRPLTALDLKNCNEADLHALRSMIEQEIELRLPQVPDEERPLPLILQFEKSELLTGQLNLKDDALTTRQIESLMAIKSQLEQENDRRIDQIVEVSRQAFEKTLEEDRLKGEAFREAIKQEYGEEKGIRLVTLVYLDNANAEPTMENWGIMKVSLAEGQDAAMDFVRQHADEAMRIDAELEKKAQEILHDSETRQHHFGISTMSSGSFAFEGVSPDQVFERSSAIKAALIEQGGCGKNKYPNLFDDLTVAVSVEDRVDFGWGKLTVGIDVRKSLDENLATIRAAAEEGNPKTVREKMGITADSENETQRQQETDKTWLIYALQKEQGGEGVLYYDWAHFVEVGDKNVAPTKESWGHMMIDRNADDDSVRAFILENIATIKQIATEIRQTAESLERESDDLGVQLVAMPVSISDKERITPDELFAKERQIIDALKGKGGFAKQDGRDLQIYLGSKQGVNQQLPDETVGGGEIVSITCRMESQLDEIVDYVVEQAKEKGFQLAA